jgi:hypothetical protein
MPNQSKSIEFVNPTIQATIALINRSQHDRKQTLPATTWGWISRKTSHVNPTIQLQPSYSINRYTIMTENALPATTREIMPANQPHFFFLPAHPSSHLLYGRSIGRGLKVA